AYYDNHRPHSRLAGKTPGEAYGQIGASNPGGGACPPGFDHPNGGINNNQDELNLTANLSKKASPPHKHRFSMAGGLTCFQRIAQLPAPRVEQRRANVVLAGELGDVPATRHLPDYRQLLLQRPDPSPTCHAAEHLRAADRLQTNYSAGVQCARKAVGFHTAQRLPQSPRRARSVENTAYLVAGTGIGKLAAFEEA
ncbi:hypothetical protein SAMN05518866_1401, partial [Sphingobium sp. YR768]